MQFFTSLLNFPFYLIAELEQVNMSVWACGVCDHVMEEKTASIVCIQCHQWVHLRSCAGITGKEAMKKKNKFVCSRCEKKNKKLKAAEKKKEKQLHSHTEFHGIMSNVASGSGQQQQQEEQQKQQQHHPHWPRRWLQQQHQQQ